MTADRQPASRTWKGILVRLTEEEKARLRAMLEAQGISSMSGYLRRLVVQQIREADTPSQTVSS